jgi:hypothetical protein
MRKWKGSGITALKMGGNTEEELHKRYLVCALHVLYITHIKLLAPELFFLILVHPVYKM